MNKSGQTMSLFFPYGCQSWTQRVHRWWTMERLPKQQKQRMGDVWTLVPVRLDQQLSDHSTVDEIASGAADCRLTYTMANCPQRRKREREKEGKKSSEKTRAGRFRKRRGESQSFLLGDADQESETRMSKNALRTGRRQAVE
ncbi:hypothetical protein TNCV_2451631 [Trichonephila clavipes]|nr:hypothetical protein TNCV_2451631 [Trichonephila clavipes]